MTYEQFMIFILLLIAIKIVVGFWVICSWIKEREEINKYLESIGA